MASAVPVFGAGSSPSGPPEAIPSAPSTDEELPPLPDDQDMREGREAVEREAAERARWLASPEAVRQREESRRAFAGISSADARELLPELFTEQFAKLDADPARLLSDARLVRPLGEKETAATVKEDGEGSLLDAGIPVRVEDEAGELRKVDLGLEAVAGGFEPANPLTELRIPESAAAPIEIGDEGLAISPVGVAPGASVQLLGDKDVYHHRVLEDTSMVVSPVSGGVELFDVLYSEESPETLRFELDLPDGAELRAFGGGAAEVVRGAETLATIPPPTAVDAQGTAVPVEMTVEGVTLVLHVAHREADFAMPIMVDPAIWENWYTANWFNADANTLPGLQTLAPLTNGAWQYANNYGYFYASTWPIYRDWGGSHRGLFVSTPNAWMEPNTWGRWTYSAPNIHSYIDGPVSLLPFWVDNHDCSKAAYPQPDDYTGLWGDNSWTSLRYNDSYYLGYSNHSGWGRSFHVGLTMAGYGVQMPCWRDLYVGGASLNLNDWAPPAVGSVSGVPPAEWISDTTPVNLSVNASDAGLGIYRATITPDGKGAIPKLVGCTGLYGSRCPTSTSVGFNGVSGASFGQGVRPASVAVEDPTGKPAGGEPFQTMVDYSPPEVTLDGQLAQVTKADEGEEQAAEKVEKLPLSVYNLEIEATDIGLESDANQRKRSGIEDIEAWLDGVEQEVPWEPQPCPGPDFSCPMTQTYTLVLSDLETAGLHTLEVKAIDHAGNVREREIEFKYFPATGMKDEYVMQYFPLPDGQGNEAEEEHPDHPELAVNVMNGNLVYREEDVDVESTAAVDLEVDRYYNSMLPDSENTEWGDGWTMGQAPELEPEQTEEGKPPTSARMLRSSAVFEPNVALPTKTGGTSFDPALRSRVSRLAGGGYEVSDETGESATSTVFAGGGKVTELRTPGYAKVDYDYEGGELAGIEVTDPATFEAEPGELGIPEPPPPPSAAHVSTFGSTGAGDGQLRNPSDLAVDAQGNLWVADTANDRVQKLDSGGQFLAKFGTSGAGNGQLDSPSSVAIDAGGDVWVADAGNDRVQKFSPAGQFLAKFGASGSATGQLSAPEGIAIGANGDVWVADAGNHRIQRFSSAGAFLEVVAPAGLGGIEPAGIDAGPGGTIWVTDWSGDRVVGLGEAGELVREFGESGSGPGQLDRPGAIEVDTKGSVWVADQGNARVQQFDRDGSFISKFGSRGSGEAEFALPSGIAADDAGNLWVLDSSRARTPAPPPLDGPVAALSFDEGEGVLARDSTHGHDGTLNGATWTEAGKYSAALSFDGVDDLLTIPDANALDFTDAFTLEAWVRPAEANEWSAVFTKERNGSLSYQLHAEGPNEAPIGSLANGEDFADLNGEGQLPSGEWSHLALTSDGEQMRLYVNGALDASGPAVLAATSAGDLQVGGNLIWEEDFFKGLIDEIRLYDRVLGQAEIEADRQTPIGSAARPAPVAAYAFDEGAGKAAHDSASGHDGTLTGATWTEDGKFGGALSFDGVDDLLAIPDSDQLDFTQAFTVEAWVRPDSAQAHAPVLLKESPSFYAYRLDAGGVAEGTAEGRISDADWSWEDVESEEELPSGDWSHLALTYDGADLRLYLNGELVDEEAAPSAQVTGGDLKIGGGEELSDYFAGQIDEVRLYGKALAAGEIAEDMQTAVGPEPKPTPVAALSFDEAKGAVARDSADDHDATLRGATWTEAGRYGAALSFDGVDDLLSVPDANALDFTDAFTLEAWVRPEQHQNWATVFAKGGEGVSDYSYLLYASDSPEEPAKGWIADSEEHERSVQAAEMLPLDAWSHLAMTSDGEQLRLYVGGELVDTAVAVSVRKNSAPLRIGGNEEWSEWFRGQIDEVRLYDEALGAGDIADDMETAIGPAPKPIPVAAYSFDEGSGTTAYDDSGEENDGVIEGAEWAAGKHGAALKFGGEDCLTVPDSPELRLTDAFTLEAWIRPEGDDGFDPVIFKEDASYFDYLLAADSNEDALRPQGAVAYELYSSHMLTGSPEVPVGAWSHLALTYDGADLRAYLNGELAGTGEAPWGLISGEEALRIGCTPKWEDGMTGLIDDVRIYRRALSEAELAEDRDAAVEPPHNRLQLWAVPADDAPVYHSSFGTAGTDEGEFNHPADVALDSHGNLWVADQDNHRIQKFDPSGEFVSQFGTLGSSDGQLNRPAALAIDAGGYIWVADKQNHRIQQFSPEGEFISKFGSQGTGEGQLNGPEGLAIDANGNIWVSDTYNYRIQKFNQAGEFLEVVNPAGLGAIEPTGIDVGPGGSVWVADWAHNRVVELSEGGKFIRAFGSAGAGPGQFNRPDAIEVDGQGNLWVGDQNNGRIQRFDQYGKYLGQFGAKGTGAGQFEFGFPFGLAVGGHSRLWIADRNNNRVQRWEPPFVASEVELSSEDDPSVDIETDAGLVTSVTGEEAGEHSYDYDGEFLVSHDGPEGETTYEKDEAGRLTKVTLPNGTYGEIVYFSDGRVEKVTVAPEGVNPKTIEFQYTDEPQRRTVVVLPDAPNVTYEIGADGSVLEWRNAANPPTIDFLTGSLYDFKEEMGAIEPGDLYLDYQAHSEEGIASVQVIVNGDQLVDEAKCGPEVPVIECKTPPLGEWVTETGGHAPGILYIEVLATDSNGWTTGERFWVDIPETLPPPPGAPVPPKFKDIQQFRQDYGLEVVFPVASEIELNERILNLINAWYNGHTPAGEVARASMERWGVPLRPEDVAELEYREAYLEVDGPLIDEWALAHYPSSYAGYEVQHSAGGKIRIGFTESQEERVAEFLQQVKPPAADRTAAFGAVPARSLASLEELDSEVTSAVNSDPELMGAVAGVEVERGRSKLLVETTNVGITEARLAQLFGSLNRFSVVYVPNLPEPTSARDREGGRMLAGDRLWTDWQPESSPLFTWGTAGFGAFESKWIVQEKRWIHTPFLIAAGHMGATGALMYRDDHPNETPQAKREHAEKIGRVGRDAYWEGAAAVDALAMRFNADGLAPRHIFGRGPVGPARTAWEGEVLCTNGAKTEQRDCGHVTGFRQIHEDEHPQHTIGVIVVKNMKVDQGDSGAPVWNPATGASVGIVISRPHPGSKYTSVQPLLTTHYWPGKHIVGALDASVMGSGSLHILHGD